MIPMSFEKHSRPNASRLEPHQSDIAEMRSQEWPYHRIRKYLDEEHCISVSSEAVRKFCLSRNVEKGGGKISKVSAKNPKKKRTPEQPKPTTSVDKETPDFKNMTDDEIYETLTADIKPKEAPKVFSKTF